jgi:3'-phosphoadenosine 5'-phosphosulfate sulfotransferase (PAPS reductase)/FAD synthetase
MTPYLFDGPTILNVSGGRTSAFMLHNILRAHDGALPADVHAVFCNTGKERPETLAFLAAISEQWGARLRWIERDLRKPAGARFREVTPETASRNGEPFDELIVERRFLPNGIMRFCTQDLKIRTARDFMRSQGYEHWTSVMGLRFDEPARVSRVRAREPDEWDVECPLYDTRVTKADVMAFWAAQPFDLGLQPHESNCDGCYLKARSILTRIERDRPGTLAWWADKESERGARFKSKRRYLDIIRVAHATPSLPLDLDLDEEPSLPCHCTD